MPITKQSVKKVRQDKKHTLRNRHYKNQMKSMIRLLTEYLSANEIEKAKKLFPGVVKAIDMAMKKHLIHKNNAAHKKSRLQKVLSTVEKGKK
ncbi:30S ribosomal protein S20 [Candidatus Peregrinibacteria bacterium]|nr:30S ribosomal protein S20 [Candidatus Peregrinibacteria bacterium]